MKKFSYTLLIGLLLSVLFSCKRDKVEVIGPALTLASPDFKILKPFKINTKFIDFSLDSGIWFHAKFDEKVSWTITFKGLKSKAEKVITGTSDTLNYFNSLWTGGHKGLNFFRPGENVVAELSVSGSNNKWYDTTLVIGEKTNYGSNVIVWWDMDQIGVAKSGGSYWFDFFDGKEKIIDTIYADKDPIQGLYRAFEGKDGLGPENYFIGGLSHTPLAVPTGFNTTLDNVYLNFYIRRRTPTTSLGGDVISDVAGVKSTLSFNCGTITWDTWQLVSIKLSTMTLKSGNPPFDPSRIVQFSIYPQIVSNPGQDQSGVDIDFITFTKGNPFNPDVN